MLLSRHTRSSRSQMFFKIGVLKNFRKFHRKTPILESLSIKVTGLRTWNDIIKRLQHRCFFVKLAKFLRTSFFYNIFFSTSVTPVVFFLSVCFFKAKMEKNTFISLTFLSLPKKNICLGNYSYFQKIRTFFQEHYIYIYVYKKKT